MSHTHPASPMPSPRTDEPAVLSALALRALEARWRSGYADAEDPLTARDEDLRLLLLEVRLHRDSAPIRGGLLARLEQARRKGLPRT